MKQTIKIEGAIFFKVGQFTPSFQFYGISPDSEYMKKSGYISVSPYTIEIEMPEGLDLHKAQLTALQDKRKLILAENEQRLNEIDNEIANFQAIEDKS